MFAIRQLGLNEMTLKLRASSLSGAAHFGKEGVCGYLELWAMETHGNTWLDVGIEKPKLSQPMNQD